MTNFKQTFNIIKYRGSPQEARLETGEKVIRQDKLFVQDLQVSGRTYTGFVPVLDYQNHFIFESPINEHYKGYPAHLCTCGSMAVIAPTESFVEDSSQPGLAFVCYFHHIAVNERTGKKINKHADGSYG